MKKEVAEAWVADLRTNPPQCRGKLFNGLGYCCLGRLEVVLGAEFNFDDGLGSSSFNDYYLLGDKALELSGMNSGNGKYDNTALSTLNDHGKTFAEIADVIEQNWEKL